MPKVSVIIPNYNHAAFLRQRFESILEQTYQDFEIIYLDDASSDDSNNVFAEFAHDDRVHAIINEINSGSPFKQWNRGIKHASGDYIWIAESDDCAEPEFLETLVAVLDENPRVGVAYCQSRQMDEYGKFLDTMHWWTDDLSKERWKRNFINEGLDECKNYLIHKNTIPNASAVLTRKCLFEKINYAEESMRLCGDWITWVRLLLHSDIAFSPKVLNHYRTHGSSVRAKSLLDGLKFRETLKVQSLIEEVLDIPKKTSNSIRSRLINDWLASTFTVHSLPDFQQVAEFYKFARSCDPNIGFKILKQACLYGFRKSKQKIKVALDRIFQQISYSK